MSAQGLDAEDAERAAIAEAAALRLTLKKLADIAWAPNHPDRKLVRSLLASDLVRITAWERHQVALMAWRNRQLLPQHLVPKMNPDDPLSPDQLRLPEQLRAPGARAAHG